MYKQPGPGRLNQRITIQTLTTARDSFADPKRTYTDAKTVWGEVETLSGRSLERAQALQAEVDTRVRIVYDDFPTLDATMRVVYGSRKLEIKYVPIVNDNARPLYIEFYCRAIARAPITT